MHSVSAFLTTYAARRHGSRVEAVAVVVSEGPGDDPILRFVVVDAQGRASIARPDEVDLFGVREMSEALDAEYHEREYDSARSSANLRVETWPLDDDKFGTFVREVVSVEERQGGGDIEERVMHTVGGRYPEAGLSYQSSPADPGVDGEGPSVWVVWRDEGHRISGS